MGAPVSEWVENVIGSFGYLGLAFLMLAENLFPPIPSEVILPLTGFLVGRGELAFPAALIVATSGSLAGALALYALGRWGGRGLILRHGKLLRVTEAELDRADEWFDRYGGWVVLFGRMVPFVRSVVSVPAGLSEMPLLRFAVLTTVGSGAWNTALIGAGWALGENWDRVSASVASVSHAVLFVIAATAVLGAVLWWWTRKRAP
jgi:membrane protein DedA with SNARE-associated domain